MTRKTSRETYLKIKANGLLSKLRLMVYECLYELGPMTQGECFKYLNEHGHSRLGHSISPRFAELKNLGVIEEYETRLCNLTGRNCIAWQTTDRLPVKFIRKTKDEIIRKLKEEIERLKKLLGEGQRELFNIQS